MRCALDLEKRLRGAARIVLIDRNSSHLFTPALYEIASAYPMNDDPYQLYLRKAVSISYGEIFEDKKVDLVQAEVATVNLGAKHVILDSGDQIDFDYLVIGLGSQSSDFGISGVNEYAYKFKTTEDAMALHQKLESLLLDVRESRLVSPAKVLVIGAGFTGIELAAELRTCGRKLAIKHGLSPQAVSVTLFEAGPKILPMISDSELALIRKRLTNLGIIIMEDSAIESVFAESIKLKDGKTINGSAVVWTAGVRPSAVAAGIHGMPLTPKGKIIVNQFLRVEDQANVFAVGDTAEFIDPKNQKPVPGLAYVAAEQGRVAAKNVIAAIHGKSPKSYNPNYGSWIAPVGGKFAVAHVEVGTLSGYGGWFVRLLVDLKYFLSILPFKKALRLFRKDLILFSKND